jgi:hypothetical protein
MNQLGLHVLKKLSKGIVVTIARAAHPTLQLMVAQHDLIDRSPKMIDPQQNWSGHFTFSIPNLHPSTRVKQFQERVSCG